MKFDKSREGKAVDGWPVPKEESYEPHNVSRRSDSHPCSRDTSDHIHSSQSGVDKDASHSRDCNLVSGLSARSNRQASETRSTLTGDRCSDRCSVAARKGRRLAQKGKP